MAKAAMVSLALLVMGTISASIEIKCGEALNSTMPCTPYTKGFVPEPSLSHCSGMTKVKELADSEKIRNNLCDCLRKGAKATNISYERSKLVPQVCKIKGARLDCGSEQDHIQRDVLSGENVSSLMPSCSSMLWLIECSSPFDI